LQGLCHEHDDVAQGRFTIIAVMPEAAAGLSGTRPGAPFPFPHCPHAGQRCAEGKGANVGNGWIRPGRQERTYWPMAAKALSFQVGDNVVYPKHGVGRVIEVQASEIAGTKLELYVLRFDKERMTLKVPTNKAESVGMRKLSSEATLKDALLTLKGKPRIKRIMWSRRAQEYEAKINSGDLVSIAEVVRDLHRAEDQPEQSYSERQIFEAAISRLAREVAAMKNIDEPSAQREIESVLKAA
jgi:CarD family transcriptional regulator